jgi:hypothetical protein
MSLVPLPAPTSCNSGCWVQTDPRHKVANRATSRRILEQARQIVVRILAVDDIGHFIKDLNRHVWYPRKDWRKFQARPDPWIRKRVVLAAHDA